MLRPWIDPRSLRRLPVTLVRCIESCAIGTGPFGLHLHAGDLARAVEDVLLAAGVRLWYGARPAAVVVDHRRLGALCVGGGCGVVALPAAFIVDATVHATVARLLRVPRPSAGESLRLAGVLTAEGGSDGDTVIAGADGVTGHLRRRGRHACWEVELPGQHVGPLAWARAVRTAQSAVAQTCDRLRRASEAMAFTPQRGCDMMLPRPTGAFPADDSGVVVRPDLAVLSAHAPAAGGAWLDPLAVLGEGVLAAVVQAAVAARAGWRMPPDGAVMQLAEDGGDEVQPSLADPAFDEPEAVPWRLRLDPPRPAAHAEALVVGAGTSGFPAAVAAAQAGLSTICIDGFAEAGGANTVGGVAKLWYGRWTPALNRWYRHATEPTRLGGLSPAQAMTAYAEGLGVDRLPLLPACGTAVVSNRVVRVYAIGPEGRCAVAGDAVIDATGDGAVAAWSGAAYTWGRERDEITLWASFGSFRHGRSEASRQFLACADPRSLADVSRAAIGLRRLPGSFGKQESPVFYLVPRETRHITGRCRLTYEAMVRGAWQPDVLVAARSNIDIKGVPGSDLVVTGFIERDYNEVRTCRIPWGALLPRGFANLLVVGRAYDASPDALAMARMQPDMAAMGLAAGHALALARQAGCNLPNLDIAALQARLIEVGILLPADLLCTPVDSEIPMGDDLEMLAERIATCPTPLTDQVRLIAAGAAAREPLERRFGEDAYYNRDAMARILCRLGSPCGRDAVLAQLDGILDRPDELHGHPPFHVFAMPDHGWAPPGAHAIATLGLAGDRRLVARLGRCADLLHPDPAVCDWHFCWLFAIAWAAERLADPEAAPALHRLLDLPALRDRLVPRGLQPAVAAAVVPERYAYLALSLARALARCGDRDGYERLIGWLADRRLFLCRSARRELADLLSVDHGFDIDAWRECVAAAALAPRAWTRVMD